jgi:Tfp pilus assembly PilM family ATPase
VARLLALDWAPRRLRLISATTARGKVRIEQTVVWEEAETLSPVTAEDLGKRLREQLRAVRMAPAPLLGCFGREQFIIKEVRYPQADPAQEPALVRFQATKELTEPPDSVVIDYVVLGRPAPGGERRANIFIARRDLVSAFKTMCRAAGLKPLALTPRAFGLAACLARQGEVATEEGAAAVVAHAEGVGEFCVAQGEAVLFARPLPESDEGLIDEARRNLSLYGGQPQAVPVRALYAAGDAVGLLSRLQTSLPVPVRALDPFAGVTVASPPEARAGFAGVVGMVRLWAERDALPVNFVAPKEPKVSTDTGRRRLVRAAGVAVLGLIAAFALVTVVLAGKRSEVDALKTQRDMLADQLQTLQPAKKRLADLKEWHQSALSVLDELYDLAARFPYVRGVKVTRLEFGPPPGSRSPREKAAKGPTYTMRMTVTGQVGADQGHLVFSLVDAINQDSRARANAPKFHNLSATDKAKAKLQEFTFYVDIRPGQGYTAVLPPHRPAARHDEDDDDDDDALPFFQTMARPSGAGRMRR